MPNKPAHIKNTDAAEAKPLVVAIASRALFNLDEAHKIFEQQGLEAYASYQRQHEDELLGEGVAFPLVRKLLMLNKGREDNPLVEVILLSRNSADSGLRIFNTIEAFGLDIIRAAFTNGEPPQQYMRAFGAQLFLSANGEDVRNTLESGFAAATILPSSNHFRHPEQLRIAFDGDAVIFSDEAEKISKASGLAAFSASEKAAAHTPLQGGPFRQVLQALHRIQSAWPIENNPIRTALVTARSAPAHKRVILTLRDWGIRIDEALFLGGKEKGAFLSAFGADIFFDDQTLHCESAQEHVPTGHVPHGVANQ
ncbi:MAG: 5'-nucleotidase [Xanthomonadales bacterium]|nr:5'-nucleotidase [Xanthomonadales bacterium]